MSNINHKLTIRVKRENKTKSIHGNLDVGVNNESLNCLRCNLLKTRTVLDNKKRCGPGLQIQVYITVRHLLNIITTTSSYLMSIFRV